MGSNIEDPWANEGLLKSTIAWGVEGVDCDEIDGDETDSNESIGGNGSTRGVEVNGEREGDV